MDPDSAMSIRSMGTDNRYLVSVEYYSYPSYTFLIGKLVREFLFDARPSKFRCAVFVFFDEFNCSCVCADLETIYTFSSYKIYIRSQLLQLFRF